MHTELKTAVKQTEVMFQLPTETGTVLQPFTVKELTIKQLQQLGRDGKAFIRKQWLEQVHEVANTLDKQERVAFLVAAAKAGPDIEAHYATWAAGEDGIRMTLVMACPELGPVWEPIRELLEVNDDALATAYRAALGIPEPVDEPEGNEEPEAPLTEPGQP